MVLDNFKAVRANLLYSCSDNIDRGCVTSFRPSLVNERAVFSCLDPRPKALSGDALTSGLLLFRHVGDGCDQRFEQRLQLRLLTEALHQFDPRSHRSFAGIFEGVERAARHAHALRHVGLGNFFLYPQRFQPLRQSFSNFVGCRKIKV